MHRRAILGGAAMVLFVVVPATYLSTQPSFNGTTAGCGGGSCHASQAGIVSTSTNGLAVTITLSGTTGDVAGELVNASGTVVAVNNKTSSNPFVLTAPAPGTYTVNAGFKNPNLRWDTKSVTVSTTSVAENEKPVLFALDQNYPNPFNPKTVISFQLSVASHVTLVVHDVHGHQVAELANGTYPAGKHEFAFDAGALASGAYYYSLRTGDVVSTRRMILVR